MTPAVPPGDVLAMSLASHHKTAADLIAHTGLNAQCVHGILDATLEVNQAHAEELGKFFESAGPRSG